MGYIIYTDGLIERDIEPKNGTDFSLEELREHIGGGWVQMKSLDSIMTMCMDEEGQMKNLAINPFATKLFHECGYHKSDYIVGTVFICKRSEVK